MDENLYYEADVKFSGDVSKVYEDAAARNAKYYRGVSPSGKYFGWVDGHYVSADDGQEWFENPNYIASEQSPTEDEPLYESKEEEVEPVSDVAPIGVSFDFEAHIAELEKALAEKDEQLREKAARLVEDEIKLAELKNAVKVIIDFIREV